jgi:hypothetical protein
MFLQFRYFWALCHHWETHMVSILCCLAGHLMFFLALVLAAHIQSWSSAHLVKPVGLLVKGGWSRTSWCYSTTKSFRKSAFWRRDMHRIGGVCSRIVGAIRLSWWSCSQFTRMVSKQSLKIKRNRICQAHSLTRSIGFFFWFWQQPSYHCMSQRCIRGSLLGWCILQLSFRCLKLGQISILQHSPNHF